MTQSAPTAVAPPPDASSLLVNEIFYSIQGESTWAGQPCVFVRLTGCPSRCNYCDTQYAFYDGAKRSLQDILSEVSQHACPLVEITGGEPLLQPNVHPLMCRLADSGRTVLLETSGACDITPCDPRVIRILDIKTPDSGEAESNHWPNLERLRPADEVKFVICSRGDYEWARQLVGKLALNQRVKAVLFAAASAVDPTDDAQGVAGLPTRDLARWILADNLPVRLQLQLHKFIWGPQARGV
jgi:7-carboxy-7-deazaguanine synthase